MPDRKLCECGCGEPAPIARMTNNRLGHVKGQPMRYILGHRHRKDHGPRPLCACGCGQPLTDRGWKRGCRILRGHQRGEENPRWNGGETLNDHGYVLKSAKEHPRADARGYVREHILVAERALGKALPDGAVVHHVNGDKADNRPANLVICEDQAYHLLIEERTRAIGGIS